MHLIINIDCYDIRRNILGRPYLAVVMSSYYRCLLVPFSFLAILFNRHDIILLNLLYDWNLIIKLNHEDLFFSLFLLNLVGRLNLVALHL